MSNSHRYHWLVLRDQNSLTLLSLQMLEDTRSGRNTVNPANVVVIDIPDSGNPPGAGVASILRVRENSTGAGHAVISPKSWNTKEEAIAWTSSDAGKDFLRANSDALLVAIPN